MNLIESIGWIPNPVEFTIMFLFISSLVMYCGIEFLRTECDSAASSDNSFRNQIRPIAAFAASLFGISITCAVLAIFVDERLHGGAIYAVLPLVVICSAPFYSWAKKRLERAADTPRDLGGVVSGTPTGRF